MKKKELKLAVLVLAIVVVFSFIAVPVGAQETEAEANSTYELLLPYVYLYNDNIDQIPDVVKSLFAGEKIILHVSMEDDSEELIGIVTTEDSCLIEQYLAGGVEEPTLRVYIDRATIDRHLANPVSEEIIDTAVNLKMEGVGIGNQIKVFVLSLAQKIVGLFAD
ncbi:MAG: hypothetical protein SVV67_06495 [Bacillota bacterium]|nr:hypothetical protein [Bacillota bacterium]